MTIYIYWLIKKGYFIFIKIGRVIFLFLQSKYKKLKQNILLRLLNIYFLFI